MKMRELGSIIFFCLKSIAEEEGFFEDMYERYHLSTIKETFSPLCTGKGREFWSLNSIFQGRITIIVGTYLETTFDP